MKLYILAGRLKKSVDEVLSGTYTVPDGVTTLRVRFIAFINQLISNSQGHLMDDIKIINNY